MIDELLVEATAFIAKVRAVILVTVIVIKVTQIGVSVHPIFTKYFDYFVRFVFIKS
jgi:hypothetical protein